MESNTLDQVALSDLADPCNSDYQDFLFDLEDELIEEPWLIRDLSARLLDVIDRWRAGEAATWEEQGAFAAAIAGLLGTIYADP